jgi:site-specific DNA recombinase
MSNDGPVNIHSERKVGIRRVALAEASIILELSGAGLAELLEEGAVVVSSDQLLVLEAPVKLRRRGVETKLVLDGDIRTEPKTDGGLIRVIGLAHRCLDDLARARSGSIRELARRYDVDESNLSRILPLAFLAPDIVQSIVDGTQPDTLTLQLLKRIGALPHEWEAQRKALGFIG